MTLSQELTTIEHIARLTLNDLSAAEASHDRSKYYREIITAMLDDCAKEISDEKLAALAFGR